jgi:hypothetical protein
MRVKAIFIILALSALLFPDGQARAAGQGLYLGGSIGQSTLEDDLSTTLDSFNEKDTSYRVFGGYRLGILPLLDLALETGYRDLGNPEEKIDGQTFKVDLTGYDLSALVILPVGPIDFYLKAGELWFSIDKSYANIDKSDDDFGAIFGAGIGARLWKLGLRAEYEVAAIDQLDKASMYWFSVYYTF